MSEKIGIGSRKKRIFIGVAILIVLIFIAIYVYSRRLSNKIYTDYSVANTIKMEEMNSQTSVEYLPYGSGVVRYSGDGISYYSGGKEVWNKAIDMTSLVVDICGDYIVMAERNSNEIFLFDKGGNQSNIVASYPIVSVEVSRQGVVAATLDDGNVNYIEMTDKEGTRIASGQTVITGDGYPVDISIANDGTRLVSSYLAVSNGSTQSKVVFYNFSSVGQNEIDRIVGGFNQYKTTLVPDVEFINNTTAVAFGDNMFSIYHIDEKPELTYEEEFNDKIDMVFHSSKYIGFIFESNDSSYSQVLKVYNTSGKKVFSKTLDFKFNNISFVGKNVVMNDESTCRMYSFSGTERFNTTFDKNIVKLVPIKDNKFVIISDSDIEEIELK